MSPVINISEFKSEQDFSQIIAGSTSHKPALDAASLTAIWSTLSLLRPLGATQIASATQLSFLPSHLTLVVNVSPGKDAMAPHEAQDFLFDLTRAAHVTGSSLACSSVLAGLSSESDEYGDVSLWLGDVTLDEDKEEHVIKLLGLDHWLQNGGRIVRSKSSTDPLPSGLAQIPRERRSTAETSLDALTSHISRLEQRFEFRLEGGQGHGGNVIWVLLGKLTLGKEQAWAGLIGAGTWGEEDE